MSKLFIELYLDEDVSVLIAELIRARGFTAVTTRDAKQFANDDSEQLAYATSQRILQEPSEAMKSSRLDDEIDKSLYLKLGRARRLRGRNELEHYRKSNFKLLATTKR